MSQNTRSHGPANGQPRTGESGSATQIEERATMRRTIDVGGLGLDAQHLFDQIRHDELTGFPEDDTSAGADDASPQLTVVHADDHETLDEDAELIELTP